MSDDNGLIWAYLLDGRGGGRQVGWDEVRSWRPGSAPLWVHLDRSHPESGRWLREQSGLDALICEALLAEETRPRSVPAGDGLLVILRGVNLHPEADPEDMVSIRIWIETERLVTLRARHVMAAQDVRESLMKNHGPADAADLLVRLASRLTDRAGPVIEGLDGQVDSVEEEMLTAESYELRARLSDFRRQGIALRRYLAPQRDVLTRLLTEDASWLTPLHRARLREVADRVTRYVEDLDSARDRASVTQEELAGRLAEQMNKTMYILSLVAAVFLPLGLITGLLGINVGGIPGANFRWAFTFVSVLLVVIAIVQIAMFRRMKWL